jgi:hypothetical protein
MIKPPKISAKALFWLWPFALIYYAFVFSFFIMGWRRTAATAGNEGGDGRKRENGKLAEISRKNVDRNQ